MERVLIVAPHVDDELIGCYSVLQDKNIEIDIIWCFDLTAERRMEAIRMAKEFSITPHFIEYFRETAIISVIENNNFDRVYVPSIRDWHPEHKLVNRLTRLHATHFYSVDMVNGKVLSENDRRNKLSQLNTYFPSQKTLWENNGLYYLFESIHTSDITKYRKWTMGTVEVYYTSVDALIIEELFRTVSTTGWPDTVEATYNEILSKAQGPIMFDSPAVLFSTN